MMNSSIEFFSMGSPITKTFHDGLFNHNKNNCEINIKGNQLMLLPQSCITHPLMDLIVTPLAGVVFLWEFLNTPESWVLFEDQAPWPDRSSMILKLTNNLSLSNWFIIIKSYVNNYSRHICYVFWYRIQIFQISKMVRYIYSISGRTSDKMD